MDNNWITRNIVNGKRIVDTLGVYNTPGGKITITFDFTNPSIVMTDDRGKKMIAELERLEKFISDGTITKVNEGIK